MNKFRYVVGVYVCAFIAQWVFACNPIDQQAIFLMKNDQQEAVALKVQNGEALSGDEEILYKGYYRRALQNLWDKLPDRYWYKIRASYGGVKSLAYANELDGVSAYVSENFIAEYLVPRRIDDVIYSIFSTRFSSIKINGTELSEGAKNAIAEIDEDVYEHLGTKGLFKILEKDVDINELELISRSCPNGECLIQTEDIYNIIHGMEENDTAIIHFHRLFSNVRENSSFVAEPAVIHYNRGVYYLKSSLAAIDTELVVFSKAEMLEAPGSGTVKLSPSEVYLREKVLGEIKEHTDVQMDKLMKIEEQLRTLDPASADFAHLAAQKEALIGLLDFFGRQTTEIPFPSDSYLYSIVTRRVH
jgi:hypothetical protein